MNIFKKILALSAAAAIMLSQGLTAFAQDAAPSGTAYADLGSKIEEFVLEHKDTTFGMDVSVFNADGTVYSNYFGYADKEASVPVDSETVMEWGSVTKLLVWTSVMQLYEQGRLDLDADVREYLPDGFLTNLSYDKPVTMTNLMNHDAGFQEVFANIFVSDPDLIIPLGDALKAHMPEQIYEPGTVVAYSNWGVALAGYIVECISGESFDAYVHAHIFEPLGMEHSALSADLSDNEWVKEKRSELQCYTTDGKHMQYGYFYLNLYPAGMCTSTLSDFETFAKALLDENSPLFEKAETYNTLFTPTKYLGDTSVASNYHGFWAIPYAVETIGHGGNTAGCSSYLLLDLKNKVGAVVMTNQGSETVYNMDMMKLIFGEYSETDYFTEEQTIPKSFFRPARTVRVGPFKIVSCSFTLGRIEDTVQSYSANGVERICAPYADFIQVPTWLFVIEVSLFILLGASFVFSVISLLVKLIRKIINALRKKKQDIFLGGWSTVTAFVQLAVLLMLAWLAASALTYSPAFTYTWVCFGMIAAAIILTVLAVYGFAKTAKTDSSKIRKFYNTVTAVFAVLTVVNIIYWNMFMFTKI